MGEKTDEIEQHIREQRRELGQNISELQQKVKDTVNWRVQFEHCAGQWIIAFWNTGFQVAHQFREPGHRTANVGFRTSGFQCGEHTAIRF
jgi:hypothetical protein